MSTPNEFTLEINKLINYLAKFTREQSNRVLDDKKSYSSLFLIGKTLNSNSDDVDFGIFVKKRFDQVISNYLNEILKIRSSIDFQTKIDWKMAETATDRNEILAQTFTYVIDITNEIVQSSVEFCSLFVENDGLHLCLEFLRDQVFLNKNENVKIMSGHPISIADFLTMIIANLANRTCDEQKHKWKSLNAAEILIKIGEVNPATRLNSYYTLAYLLDDKQIEHLFEQNKMKVILDALLRLLVKASINFKENDCQRFYIQIIFKGKSMKYDVHHVIRDDGILTSIGGVLMRLYKLSVNDSIKLAIYFDENAKDCFKVILEKGNLIEIFYALELLAQLTFNEKIKQNINESKKYEKIFDTLMKKDIKKLVTENDRLVYTGIRQLIEQIQWNLNEEHIQPNISLKTQKLSRQQHIMLSYHSSNREICLKIKRLLESMGHKVWIDVNLISGLSLESMANVVVNSFCVLICVNENYRQSIYCQLEVRYALKLNKPIIPLIMQQDYEDLKGWLGILMNDKIAVNFMKYDFEECMKRLKHEIDSIKRGSKNVTFLTHGETEIYSNRKEDELKFSQNDGKNQNEKDLTKNALEYLSSKSTENTYEDSAIDYTEGRGIDSSKSEENDFSSKTDGENANNLVQIEDENLAKLAAGKDLSFLPEATKNESLENASKYNDVSVMNWTEEKVKEWFVLNDLNLLIFEHFKPCNGKILKQLFDTKQAALEFYIQPMSKIENVEFKNIMSFGACLDDLFNKKLK